jgi:hypothetical protein
MNVVPLIVVAGMLVLGGLTLAGVWYWFSPRYTDVGYRPRQPVPFSHALHSGEHDLDCRYCHASVELSPVANIPPTQICMNCHKTVNRDSELLAPIRESAETGRRMQWVRVHNLPDYTFFDHSIHVSAGVGCASCHGPVQTMEVLRQFEPLSMQWCLDCHRNPDPHLRPLDQVTNMKWQPPEDQLARAAVLREQREIAPSLDCTSCHR